MRDVIISKPNDWRWYQCASYPLSCDVGRIAMHGRKAGNDSSGNPVSCRGLKKPSLLSA